MNPAQLLPGGAGRYGAAQGPLSMPSFKAMTSAMMGANRLAHAAAQQGEDKAAVETFHHGRRKRINLLPICQCIFLPWILFCVTYALLSFSPHYHHPNFVYLAVTVLFLVVPVTGSQAWATWKAKRDGLDREPTWYIFLFLAVTVAWASALVAGTRNFKVNSRGFYDLQNLNFYGSVDPSKMKGQQVMDAGQMIFTPNSKLNLKYSMGFMNDQVYCVAPVTLEDGPLQTYDFWAVGMNCCSGSSSDYHCGQYDNPHAHSGVRVMDDDQRPFYRLAVQQAEATYNIKSIHPIFVYWIENASDTGNMFRDAAYKSYILGMFLHFSFNILCVAWATMSFSKMGYTVG